MPWLVPEGWNKPQLCDARALQQQLRQQGLGGADGGTAGGTLTATDRRQLALGIASGQTRPGADLLMALVLVEDRFWNYSVIIAEVVARAVDPYGQPAAPGGTSIVGEELLPERNRRSLFSKIA